jgi:hypothetical protein
MFQSIPIDEASSPFMERAIYGDNIALVRISEVSVTRR